MNTTSAQSGSRMILLLLSLVAAGFISLSIHVGALLLGDPYPSSNAPQWARWFNSFSSYFGILLILLLARPKLQGLKFLTQTLILFGIVAAIGETLRGTVMNGFASKAYAYAFLGLPDLLLRSFVVALLCTAAIRWVRSPLSLTIAAMLVTVIVKLAGPVIFGPLAGLQAQFAYLERPEVYDFPYPLSFQIPAYLMFLEPVVGATALAYLIWDRLPGTPLARALSLGVLVALVKGVVGMTFLFIFYMDMSPLAGMVSYGQFLLEFLALGFLTGLAWNYFGPAAGPRASAHVIR
ncbi:hypothetical protein [Novosphingobium lindaniclasticum]|uniref:hypothetical protein n=1 Tax=Novosphingobium lindaniclasticum TaxID=1329895 RepID=UPI00240A8EED|nr:hypothetical protein [Novosphingobium lindaniclasticum]